jgi:hypothetical protein
MPLDLWIIEKLLEREKAREREARQLELPVYEEPHEGPKTPEVEESQRGVVVIDL